MDRDCLLCKVNVLSSPTNECPFFFEDVTAVGRSTGVTSIDNLASPVGLLQGTYWLSIVENAR
jgi:hypothetical protein